jgi:peroxiredoxin
MFEIPVSINLVTTPEYDIRHLPHPIKNYIIDSVKNSIIVEFLKQTQEKTHVSFTLISDTAYLISSQFDVAFKPKNAEILLYNTMLGANLKQAHSDDSQTLPIPATFILNKEGIVVWRHVDPNYKKRSSAQDIVSYIPIN